MAQIWGKLTADEVRLAMQIVERARKAQILQSLPERGNGISLLMDIQGTHAVNPLRLADLLAADDFNFSHDICGIDRHFDRETGQLTRGFTPRYSA